MNDVDHRRGCNKAVKNFVNVWRFAGSKQRIQLQSTSEKDEGMRHS